jgi:Ulp1 family protease
MSATYNPYAFMKDNYEMDEDNDIEEIPNPKTNAFSKINHNALNNAKRRSSRGNDEDYIEKIDNMIARKKLKSNIESIPITRTSSRLLSNKVQNQSHRSHNNNYSNHKTSIKEEDRQNTSDNIDVNDLPLEEASIPAEYYNNSSIYCIYPPEDKRDAVTISYSDIPLLRPGEFLNDNLIDFYLKWIQRQVVPESEGARMYFFNSFFYSKWRDSYNTCINNNKTSWYNYGGNRARRSELITAERYELVKSWTKGVNIFEKDFLFIPINENAHWSLVVVCYPAAEYKPSKAEQERIKKLTQQQRSARSQQRRKTNLLQAQQQELDFWLPVQLHSENRQKHSDSAANFYGKRFSSRIAHNSSEGNSGARLGQDSAQLIKQRQPEMSGRSISQALPEGNSSDFEGEEEGKLILVGEPSNFLQKFLVPGDSSRKSRTIPIEANETAQNSDDLAGELAADQSENSEDELELDAAGEFSAESLEGDDPLLGKIPCMLHFDSLALTTGRFGNQLRLYLQQEWNNQQKIKLGTDFSPKKLEEIDNSSEEQRNEHAERYHWAPAPLQRTINSINMPYIAVKVPEQQNSWDCGYFLLHYVENFVKNPFSDLRKPTVHRENWFEATEIEQKRRYMRQILEELHLDYEKSQKSQKSSKLQGNSTEIGKKLVHAASKQGKNQELLGNAPNRTKLRDDIAVPPSNSAKSSEEFPANPGLNNIYEINGPFPPKYTRKSLISRASDNFSMHSLERSPAPVLFSSPHRATTNGPLTIPPNNKKFNSTSTRTSQLPMISAKFGSPAGGNEQNNSDVGVAVRRAQPTSIATRPQPKKGGLIAAVKSFLFS